jgi:hypothetical protein
LSLQTIAHFANDALCSRLKYSETILEFHHLARDLSGAKLLLIHKFLKIVVLKNFLRAEQENYSSLMSEIETTLAKAI